MEELLKRELFRRMYKSLPPDEADGIVKAEQQKRKQVAEAKKKRQQRLDLLLAFGLILLVVVACMAADVQVG